MKAIFMLHGFFPLFTMNLEFHSYSKNSVLVIVVRSKESFIKLEQVVSETVQVLEQMTPVFQLKKLHNGWTHLKTLF